MAAPDNYDLRTTFITTTNNIVVIFSTLATSLNSWAADVYWRVRRRLFGDEPLLRITREPRRGFPLNISRMLPECPPIAAFFTLAPAMVGGGEARRRWR